MKYYIANEYGCVYWLENGKLNWTPQSTNGVFDTTEGGEVDRPHNEVPEEYFNKVITKLGV